jgi:hypothetical protein
MFSSPAAAVPAAASMALYDLRLLLQLTSVIRPLPQRSYGDKSYGDSALN